MGLFDQLLGGVVGQFGDEQQKDSLMNLATGVIQGQPGGLSGCWISSGRRDSRSTRTPGSRRV